MSYSERKSKKSPKEKYKNKRSLDDDYEDTLEKLKNDINDAKIKASKTINQELIKLYLTIDSIIKDRRENHGWNAILLEKLICDLQKELPKLELFCATH